MYWTELLDLPMVDQLMTQDVILPSSIVYEQCLEAPKVQCSYCWIAKLSKAVFRTAEQKTRWLVNRPNIFGNETQSIVS